MTQMSDVSPELAQDAKEWFYEIQSRMLTNDWGEIWQVWPKFMAWFRANPENRDAFATVRSRWLHLTKQPPKPPLKLRSGTWGLLRLFFHFQFTQPNLRKRFFVYFIAAALLTAVLLAIVHFV